MNRVFELRIELEHTEPTVWRQLVVPETFTLYELHHAIQIAFGWKNYHLHSFISKGQIIGNVDLLDDPEASSDRIIFVNQVLQKKNDSIRYEYDFGDGWMHSITLEKINPNDAEIKIPVVIDGAMACPPEDCGGIPGYENLKEVMTSSKHPEYKDLVKWLGKAFDPEEFNMQKVNREMKNLKKYIKEYESAK